MTWCFLLREEGGKFGVWLRADLDEYAAHYNRQRPGRGRNLRPPDCDDITAAVTSDLAAARIKRRQVLGGLTNEYERAA